MNNEVTIQALLVKFSRPIKQAAKMIIWFHIINILIRLKVPGEATFIMHKTKRNSMERRKAKDMRKEIGKIR